jgi:hypothetical protein
MRLHVKTLAAMRTGISRLCGFNLLTDLINHRSTGAIPESADFWYVLRCTRA